MKELPGPMDPKQFLSAQAPWTDVRDVGEAHALALEKGAAGGERIVVTAGDFTWYQWREWYRQRTHSPALNFLHYQVERCLVCCPLCSERLPL